MSATVLDLEALTPLAVHPAANDQEAALLRWAAEVRRAMHVVGA